MVLPARTAPLDMVLELTSESSPATDLPPRAWEDLVPHRWYNRQGHRWLDRGLLLLLLPPALPLMVLIAATNLCAFRDPRQVFFLQPRIGWRGRPFRIFKFRTMKVAASCDVGSWADGSDRLRVTRLGKLLRNTHLDELPQIFNILMGDMSFIGPRPEMVEIERWAEAEVPGFGERLALRPGVAGLAQITQGYTNCDVDAYREKLSINRRYAREMCLALDLSIILRTIVWMLRGKGWSWNHAGASGSGREAQPTLRESRLSRGLAGHDLEAHLAPLGDRDQEARDDRRQGGVGIGQAQEVQVAAGGGRTQSPPRAGPSPRRR